MAENKWTCPACGQENDGKFCVGCGAAKPEAAAEATTEATAAAEPVAEAAEAATAAVAAEAAEAAVEAAPAADPDEFVPEEPDHSAPAYDTTPVEQITEPIVEPVAAESVAPAYAPIEPAKVDPDNFVPAPINPAPSAGAPAVDPDNFVPAPMQPQQNTYSGASAGPVEPKPAGYSQALIGLILAIAGIVLLWVPVLGIGLAIAGLVLSIVSKSKGYVGSMRTAAFIISIVSIGLSVIGTVSCIACIACSY